MNIFNKVTLASLKKNKTRTVVTVIGIVLSASMICAVTTFVSSMQNYLLENTIYNDGDWHGSALHSDSSTLQAILNADEVESTVYGEILGYAKVDSINQNKPYLYILATSDSFESVMPVHIVSGEYPKSENEILLPMHLSENGGVKYMLGDTLTLDIGDRKSGEYIFGQHNPYFDEDDEQDGLQNSEIFEINETRTFTVVGFYERPGFEDHSAPGYTALTVAQNQNSDALYDIYFKMNEPEEVYAFIDSKGISGKANTDVLIYSGVSQYDSFSTVLYSLAVIVIALIMFGSVSLIYNAFAISVSERTKQFGLLSSVGATKKQLRRMVLFEALTVSAVGIPIGIAAGIGGIGITLLLIGHKFSSISSFTIPMRVCVSPASIIIAIIVALVTVLISAYIPSKRATKVSAVEAIRQNSDIKSKRVKTSFLTYKLFGLSGMLANKHYKRNRKKYRATVISLFMSVVLFVSASAFTEYLMDSVEGAFNDGGYDIRYFAYSSDFTDITPSQLLDIIEDVQYVTDGCYLQSDSVYSNIDADFLNTDVYGHSSCNYNEEDNTADVYTQVLFIDDTEFKELLDKYGLSEEKFMNKASPLAITVDGNVGFNFEEEKYVEMKIIKGNDFTAAVDFAREFENYDYSGETEGSNGETLYRYSHNENEDEYFELTYDEAFILYQLKSGKTIYEPPFYVTNSSGITMLYPQSLKNYVFTEEFRGAQSYTYFLTSDNHSESFASLKTILTERGFNTTNRLFNNAEEVENSINLITIIKVFSYGFIVLISLIAAANVFNTISTNINLRRREFAMLKSVGMSDRDFSRMMNYECLLYGSKALLYGLPVSVGVTYLIYLAVSEGYETGFYLPWTAILIAVLSVFAVVSVTMMYSMSKIKKDNPIDALKNENL